MGSTLNLTGLDWVVCIGLLAASIIFGLVIARMMKAGASSANFFLAGRRLLWPVVGASLFSTNIGAEHLVGLSGDTYLYGISAATVEFTTAICLGVAIFFLLPTYIKNKIFTIPEYLEMRYNLFARLFFAVLMVLIAITTKMAFTLFAGALVLNSLIPSWDIMTVVAVLGIIACIVTFIGGFTAVAYTDTFQTAIMLIGCGVMVFIGLDKVGGFEGLSAAVGDKMHMYRPFDDPNYPFWGVIAGAAYGGIFYWGMDQVNAQRMLGAPDLKQARYGALFAILLKLTPVFIFALPGLIALALFPGREAKTTFVTLLNDLLPVGVRGMVLAALLAALISSLLSIMNSLSTLVVRDFFLRANPDIPDRKQVMLGRFTIILSTVLGIAAAYLVYKNQEGLYKYLQTISIFLVMPLTPAIFFGIMSKRVTVAGAMTSFAVGFAIAAFYTYDQFYKMWNGAEAAQQNLPFLHTAWTENYTYRGLWGTIIITAVLFFVSSFTRKTAPERLAHTTFQFESIAEPFQGLKDWRLQWGILAVLTVACYVYWW